MKKEIIFTDPGHSVQPAKALSEYSVKSKWRVVPYETADICGSMIASIGYGTPPDVTLPLGCVGWCRIFVGLYSFQGTTGVSSEIELKLTSDKGFSHLQTCLDTTFADHAVQEYFWRCADLSGQDLIIGKHQSGATPTEACLAWVRIEPMTEKELDSYNKWRSQPTNKRLYATNDMHWNLCCYDMSRPDAWYDVVQDVIDCDVQWLSLERPCTDGELPTSSSEFNFPRTFDDMCFQQREYYNLEMLRSLVEYGHEKGLKMCLSQRIASCGMEFPFDQMVFDDTFAKNHPEYHCVDRDGTVLAQLSFCYTEVQDHVIDKMLWGVSAGFDALEMIMVRGFPYCLFEEPFLKQFESVYGIDARYLPLDDPRITEQRCKVMTSFVRRLRAKMDKCSPNRRLGLHARVPFSIWDCRHMGLDVEAWAKEGLITAIITHDRRLREILPKDVWQDNMQLLDLEKYRRYVREEVTLFDEYDFHFVPPREDSHGVLRGPANQQKRIAEFMEIEHKYGVTVFVDIMPRDMSPAQYRSRADEIYNCGCDHISLWDTNTRTWRKSEWAFTKWMGHKDDLQKLELAVQSSYRKIRILRIGDMDVSRYKPIWGG